MCSDAAIVWGIFNNCVIANFPLSVTVKEFSKSVNVWRRYGHMFGDTFLWFTRVHAECDENR